MGQPNANCKNLTLAERGAYCFKVDEYDFIMNQIKRSDFSGKCFQSDAFTVGGHHWALRYYPTTTSDFFSLYVVLLSHGGGGAVRARFSCTLLDKSGEPAAQAVRTVCAVFSHHGEQHGFYEFMDRKDLEAGFVSRDCFVVLCTIAVLKTPFRPWIFP